MALPLNRQKKNTHSGARVRYNVKVGQRSTPKKISNSMININDKKSRF